MGTDDAEPAHTRSTMGQEARLVDGFSLEATDGAKGLMQEHVSPEEQKF